MPDDQHSTARDSLNTMFDVLSHGTRRRILIELADHNPRTEAEFEAQELAEDQSNPTSVETRLHHTHLPNLRDAGFIDWDPQKSKITRGPRFGEIEPLLGVIDDHQDALPVDWP